MFDIIPDVHGQLEKLTHRLTDLGYVDRLGAWRHSNPWRRVLFLGDYIDRGSNNAAVIDIVRRMQHAGTAIALMGNHELNAIQYHTIHPVLGKPLRERSERNTNQHRSFLNEFAIDSKETRSSIEWMASLPLYLDMGDMRAVHACWNDKIIERLKSCTQDGVLSPEQFVDAANKGHPLYDWVETTTKGPDTRLPEGYSFLDKDGSRRRKIRVKWWKADGKTWRDISMSVPDVSDLPDSTVTQDIQSSAYRADAPPVFFGHYWLSGVPVLQSHNALCLDFSAGRDGPLVSYLMEDMRDPIDLNRIQGFDQNPQSSAA